MNKTFSQALIAATVLALGALSGTAALAQPAPAPAPTKVYDGNNLIGLNGVSVLGNKFDVRFVGGQSCAQTFSGCDSASDLSFSTQAGAEAASNALVAYLERSDFLAAASHDNLRLNTPYTVTDTIFTGYPVKVSNAVFDERTPSGSLEGGLFAVSTAPGPSDRFAVWTPSVSAVPEPGTYALMAAGLGAVGFMARRRQAR